MTSITIERQVEFVETDMAGIVHYSNYLRWVEAAESALFQKWHQPLIELTEHYAQGWPRVRVNCDYKVPVYFQDTVRIHLFILETKVKAIEYGFSIHKLGPDQPVLAARGKMTTVHVRREPLTAPMQSIAIPQAILDQLQE